MERTQPVPAVHAGLSHAIITTIQAPAAQTKRVLDAPQPPKLLLRRYLNTLLPYNPLPPILPLRRR